MQKFLYFLSFISLISLNISTPSLAQFRPDRPTFFNDGQILMEQEIQRLQQQQTNVEINQQQIEHPSQLLTINDGKLIWEKYIFRDGGFSVWMPQGIQSQETVTLETQAGNIDFQVVAIQPKSLRFVAAYSENQNLSQLGNSEQILASIRDGIITKTNFNLVQEKPINFQSYNGILLEMENINDKEDITFQIYLINQKIYVLAVSNKSNDYEKDITNFFNSFRLLQ